MKRIPATIALLLTLIIAAIIPIHAQTIKSTDWGTVVYSENLNGTTQSNVRKARQVQEDYRLLDSIRVVSRQGKLTAICETSYFMTEGVLHSIKLALDIWEERVKISVPIKFYVVISEDMDEETAISTTVLYSMKSRGVSQPRSLLSQSASIVSQDKDTIRINAFANWGVSWLYDDVYAGRYSLSTYLLRHIAHILGFGCSIVDRDNNKGFAVPRSLSPFDSMLDKNGQKLRGTFTSSAIEDYLRGDINIKASNFSYPIYTGKEFQFNTSGKYFSLGQDNIMEHPLVDASQPLTINAETLDVMEAIGWDVSPHDARIVCDSTDNQGYGSIYREYNFRIEDATLNNSSSQCFWQYQIYAKGKYTTLNTANSTHFAISPAIREESLDEFNCQQARVLCNYKGKEYTYPLFLETRPLIERVICNNKHSMGNGGYEFDIRIDTRGAESGTITVSDDAGSSLNYPITGNLLHVGPLVDGVQAYIDISLENSFGYAIDYIELGEIKEPAEAIASRDKRSIIVKCNGEQGKTVFHDGDSVTLDFEYGNSISHVDSMKWEVELTDIFDRKQRYTLSKETTASFVVAPDRKCCFAKSAYKQFNFMGGDYWFPVPHIVPDSCRFICTAYYKDWIYNTQLSVISKNYSFDVLPECPTIEELETWVVPGDEEWPISKIRINTSNYEDIQVYVSPWDYIDYQAKVLFKGDSLEFVMEPGGWNNELYCLVDNKYGVYKSAAIKISKPDGLNDHEGQATCHIKQNGREVTITSKTSCTISIYDMSGRIVFGGKGTNVTTTLPKGIYIIKAEDMHGNRLLTKKVCTA